MAQVAEPVPSDGYVDAALSAYVACALWCEYVTCDPCGEAGHRVPECEAGEDLRCGGTFADSGFGADDLAYSAWVDMRAEVEAFVAEAWADLADMAPEAAGHDLWLTRNWHGTGFWDRGLGERGDRLTFVARAYGQSSLYLGDDGRVWEAR